MKNARSAIKKKRKLTPMEGWFLSAARNTDGHIPSVEFYNSLIREHKYIGSLIFL
jgi:hypothetical protein